MTAEDRDEIIARISALDFMIVANTTALIQFIEGVSRRKSRLLDTLLEDAEKQRPAAEQLDSRRMLDGLKRRNEIIAGLLATIRKQLA